MLIILGLPLPIKYIYISFDCNIQTVGTVKIQWKTVSFCFMHLQEVRLEVLK